MTIPKTKQDCRRKKREKNREYCRYAVIKLVHVLVLQLPDISERDKALLFFFSTEKQFKAHTVFYISSILVYKNKLRTKKKKVKFLKLGLT